MRCVHRMGLPAFWASLWVATALAVAVGLSGCGAGATEEDPPPEGGYPAEGSIASPMALTAGVTHSGTVSTGTSYYVVPVSAAANYGVTLSGLTDDADLALYDDDDTFLSIACSYPFGRESPEGCSLTSSGTNLYIAVSGADTAEGAAFSLHVQQILPAEALPCSTFAIDVGTVQNPIAVPQVISKGSVTQGMVGTASSYYKVPSVPGQTNTIALTNLGQAVELHVFSNPSFTMLLGSSTTGGGTEYVDVTATGAFVYARVDSGGTKTCFNIHGVASEGAVGGPLPIPVGKNTLGVVSTDYSYYRAPVDAAGSYDVSAFSISGAAFTVDVYGPAGFGDTELCTMAVGGRSVTPCDANPITPGGPFLFLRVSQTAPDTGGAFALCVGPCVQILPR